MPPSTCNTMPASNRPDAEGASTIALTSLDLVEMLLARGANLNAQLTSQQAYRPKLDRGDRHGPDDRTTPLLRAAKAGDVAVVMRCSLAKGADATLATTRQRRERADDGGRARHQGRRHDRPLQDRRGRHRRD